MVKRVVESGEVSAASALHASRMCQHLQMSLDDASLFLSANQRRIGDMWPAIYLTGMQSAFTTLRHVNQDLTTKALDSKHGRHPRLFAVIIRVVARPRLLSWNKCT
jgi:hypothetical protein